MMLLVICYFILSYFENTINGQKSDLDLSSRALSRVPHNIEMHVKWQILYLRLDGNEIENALNDDFNGFFNLKRLSLDLNRLSVI